LTDIHHQGFIQYPRKVSEPGGHRGKKFQPRPSVTPEFKAKIVELRQRGDRSVKQVAHDFGLTGTTVRE
jgi:transposase-like protein